VNETNEERLLGQSVERDRRTKKRFHIEQDVRYKMLYGQRIAETGTGKTMNISSGGVFFTTENTLTAGMPVELSMNWPVLLHDSCPMKLMAIERYEFRTQGSRSFQQQAAALHHPVGEYRVSN
jgi:c-di-GMP-binding flagellar brake protein YcgR